MRKKMVIPISLLLIFVLTTVVSYAVSPDEQAKAFAHGHFANNKANLGNLLVDLEYAHKKEVDIVHLGEPVMNYTIPIEEFDPNKSISEQLQKRPFYDFPVMVDDKIITDYTLVLSKGEWQWVDIGGHITKSVNEMSRENNIPFNEIKILRFGGQTFLIVTEGQKEIGYLPYDSKLEKKTLSSKALKEYMVQRQQEFLEFKKNGERGLIGPNFGAYPPLDFTQKDNIVERLSRYLRNIF